MKAIVKTPTPIAIAVVKLDRRYLVGRRPAGVPLAGFSEFPGGKILANETADQAAIRECQEETGLQVESCGLIESRVYAYDHETVELNFILCRTTSQQRPPDPPFEWLTVDQLGKCRFPAANEPIIQRLCQ